MAVLLRAQKVSGAADLQVPHGYLEAAAQFRKLTDSMKALLCHFLEHFVPLVHKECIGSPVGTAHTSSELVELGQAHLVRVVDDHGVGVGNIQTCLNDGGGDKYINFTVDEAIHDLFQLMLVHLAVGKRYVGLRDQFCHAVGDLIYIVDPVVDVIDLTASGDFPADCLPDHLLIVLHNIGLNGGSVHRRLL